VVLWAPRYRQEVAKDWYESAKGYRKGESMNRAGERGSLLGGERCVLGCSEGLDDALEAGRSKAVCESLPPRACRGRLLSGKQSAIVNDPESSEYGQRRTEVFQTESAPEPPHHSLGLPAQGKRHDVSASLGVVMADLLIQHSESAWTHSVSQGRASEGKREGAQ